MVLFGDSHSYAVQRALERRKKRGQRIPLAVYRLLKAKNEIVVGDTSFEKFLEIASGLGPRDVVLSAIGGNQHAVFSTIQHPDKFDLVDPDGIPGIDDEVQIVPYRMIESYFFDVIRNRDLKSIQALREATCARMVHIIPPPPKADNEFI
jgi:hypothetical protein